MAEEPTVCGSCTTTTAGSSSSNSSASSFATQLTVVTDDTDDNESSSSSRGISTTRTSTRRTLDVISRLAESRSCQGRGSLAGWVACPLCGDDNDDMDMDYNNKSSSNKKTNKKNPPKCYALGRGIAAHLQSVHQPWNPGKAEVKKRKRQWQRQVIFSQQRKRRKVMIGDNNNHETKQQEETMIMLLEKKWEPTQAEIDAWNAKVLEIVQKVEEHHAAAFVIGSSSSSQEVQVSVDGDLTTHTSKTTNDTTVTCTATTTNVFGGGVTVVPAGKDRSGRTSVQYRQSLPAFLQAASDGNLQILQEMVQNAQQTTKAGGGEGHDDDDTTAEAAAAAATRRVRDLLDTRDRHLSTGEHWAAGSGHLDCLKYLIDTRKSLPSSSSSISTTNTSTTTTSSSSCCTDPSALVVVAASQKKLRRRDGKTALHFAARNGHLNCIRYLLQEQQYAAVVDEVSGDGTTPLHLACFGGHVAALELLIERGANVKCRNEWGCSAAHWMGMTRCSSRDDTWRLCNLLSSHGVSFVEPQKQGHTALHKAAQRKNRHVIEWMASSSEEGGAGLSEQERQLAGKPDVGGHTPSDIWLSVNGDESFAEWMRKEKQW